MVGFDAPTLPSDHSTVPGLASNAPAGIWRALWSLLLREGAFGTIRLLSGSDRTRRMVLMLVLMMVVIICARETGFGTVEERQREGAAGPRDGGVMS